MYYPLLGGSFARFMQIQPLNFTSLCDIFLAASPTISMPTDAQQFTADEMTDVNFTCTASGSPAPSLSFQREGLELNNTEQSQVGAPGDPLPQRVLLGEEVESGLNGDGLFVVSRTLTLADAEDGDTGSFTCTASTIIPGLGERSDTVSFNLTILSEFQCRGDACNVM